ncbi:MAG: SDR family NAD(P)-dependent oxidoreductase, partial [Methyloceanibacter sp.]
MSRGRKSVLVTGSSSGIGAAIAKRFGREGDHVVLLARNEERLERTAQDVRKAGGTATTYQIDLQDISATLSVAARITEEVGTPDLLVNNAGAGR